MIKKGIWGSPWVGLKNFSRFFKGYNFWTLIWNTMAISLYSLVVGTGRSDPFLRPYQSAPSATSAGRKRCKWVTYLPDSISNVVLVGMLAIFLGVLAAPPINALLPAAWSGGHSVFVLRQALPECLHLERCMAGPRLQLRHLHRRAFRRGSADPRGGHRGRRFHLAPHLAHRIPGRASADGFSFCSS